MFFWPKLYSGGVEFFSVLFFFYVKNKIVDKNFCNKNVLDPTFIWIKEESWILNSVILLTKYLCFGNEASRDRFVGLFRHKFKKSLETSVGKLYRLRKGVSSQSAQETTVQYTCAHTSASYTAPEYAPPPKNNTDSLSNPIINFIAMGTHCQE